MLPAASEQRPCSDSGHCVDNLNTQAPIGDDLTAQLLRSAGLSTGMRVLDIGCGTGELCFLAADIVGLQGMVLGVDRSTAAIRLASQRARSIGKANVQFIVHNVNDFTPDSPIDAVIGRFVLMYLIDPAVVLRRLTTFLKGGGIVVFQEYDLDGAKSVPFCEEFESAVLRIRRTLTSVGADTSTGLKLTRIYLEAGLPAPQMSLHAHVEYGSKSQICDLLVQMTRTLLPLMERTRVATWEEVVIDSLAIRIREEAEALNATLVSPPLVGAWAHKASGNNAYR